MSRARASFELWFSVNGCGAVRRLVVLVMRRSPHESQMIKAVQDSKVERANLETQQKELESQSEHDSGRRHEVRRRSAPTVTSQETPLVKSAMHHP